MNKIYVVTGPSGVGKTTFSLALSKQLGKCAVIEGDEIYHQVVGGVSAWKEGNHLDVFWKNVASLSKNYLSAGIDVIFDYIVTKDNLKYLLQELFGFDLHFVILIASRNEILNREEIKPKGLQISRVDAHLKKYTSENFEEKYILDTTSMSIENEVKEVLSGRFLVKPPIKSGLQKKYFDMVKSGSKIYEVRLNDEKRKNIFPNDFIFFGLEPDRKEWIQKQVVSRHEFISVEELADNINYNETGFNSYDEMIETYKSLYSESDIKKYGVVAFKLI